MIAEKLWQTEIDGTFLGAFFSIPGKQTCVLVRRNKSPALTGIDNRGEIIWDREFAFDSVDSFIPFRTFLYLDGTAIRKVDPANGRLVTERRLDDRVQVMPPSTAGPTYGSQDDIIGVHPDSLETNWNWKSPGGTFVTGDHLISYQKSGEITIVDVTDCMKTTRVRGPANNRYGLAVHLLDDLLVQIYWMSRFAVDLRTGELAWRIPDDRHGTHERIVFDGRTAYSAWHDLKAIDLRTGQVSWCSKLPHRIETQPYVYSKKVYVGTKDGGVHAVDAETGQVLWSFNVDYDPVAVQPRSRGEVVVLGWEVVSCYQVEES